MTTIKGGFDDYDEPPKRNDDENLKAWRGPLFTKFRSPIAWPEGVSVDWLKPPHKVTFPICALCRHIIWNWPHYDEEITPESICDACAQEEIDAQERDNY
jgi:hypothetical protein